MARESSFEQAMLTATLQSPLRLLPIEEVDLYLSGQHPRSHLTPKGVLEELHRRHPYAMLVKEGVRPKTSRHPGVLKCDLRVDDVPAAASRREEIRVAVHALNAGDTLWEAKPRRRGGFVTLGCRLVTPDGRMINDTLGRTFLPRDVRPGETVSLDMSIALPGGVPPGHYDLRFDLIDELICWFADTSGVSPVSKTILIR